MSSGERIRRIVVPTEPATTAQPQGQAHAPQRQGLSSGSRELLRARPGHLLQAVAGLDAALSEDAFREHAQWLREQYLAGYGAAPLGFVARCHLGHPYVDHRLALDGHILDHFAAGHPMPEPFAAARSLARSEAYAFIEVYDGGLLLPVLADGDVVRP
ncbi:MULTISPECIES: hypothetical protein [unclassified Streptomyces]|uniref:hypothetical protein n=1 Tax=unclassified Streptomyces TaxID=2593676 RepID=UPI0033A88D49